MVILCKRFGPCMMNLMIESAWLITYKNICFHLMYLLSDIKGMGPHMLCFHKKKNTQQVNPVGSIRM